MSTGMQSIRYGIDVACLVSSFYVVERCSMKFGGNVCVVWTRITLTDYWNFWKPGNVREFYTVQGKGTKL